MRCPELSICVGELLGVPRVALRGSMDDWHDEAIAGVLEGFRDQGVSSIVLDLAELGFAGTRGAAGMIKVLCSLPDGLCVHVVANGRSGKVLRRAGFPVCVHMYSSTDEIARYLSSNRGRAAAKTVCPGEQDDELSLAA